MAEIKTTANDASVDEFWQPLTMTNGELTRRNCAL